VILEGPLVLWDTFHAFDSNAPLHRRGSAGQPEKRGKVSVFPYDKKSVLERERNKNSLKVAE
jgi:hypothetical protein